MSSARYEYKGRGTAVPCQWCDFPAFVLVDDMLKIISHHRGEKHLNVYPLHRVFPEGTTLTLPDGRVITVSAAAAAPPLT